MRGRPRIRTPGKAWRRTKGHLNYDGCNQKSHAEEMGSVCFVKDFPAFTLQRLRSHFFSSPPCSSSQTVVVETEVSSRGLLALFDTVQLEGFFLSLFFFS